MFTRQDHAGALPVAVVNEHFARRCWGDPSARSAATSLAGAGVQPRGPCRRRQRDVKRPDLTGVTHLLSSTRSRTKRAMGLLIRADDPEALMGAIRAEVRAADIDVAVFRMRNAAEAVDDELSSTNILIGMFASFAVLALVLAAAGLYAVISYSVSQRVQEIGIRMALGALPRDIRRLVARETIVLVAVGSVLDSPAAAITRAAWRLFTVADRPGNLCRRGRDARPDRDAGGMRPAPAGDPHRSARGAAIG
jgi:hypothetical protein